MEIYKTEIIKAVVIEFISRGLDKVYAREISEWQKYYREQKFAIKLDKQMKAEIKRFTGEIKGYTVPELEEIVWEGLECLREADSFNFVLVPRRAER